MEHEIKSSPEYSLVSLQLESGESIVTESGSMVSVSSDMSVQTSTRGGILEGLKMKVLGGESFFINTYTAERGRSELMLAPPMPGDIVYRKMEGKDFFLQAGSFLAATSGVEIDTKFQGLKGFFSGHGLFMLRMSGNGELFFNSFGAVEEVSVDDFGGNYVVDTGYIVGFESSLTYKVRSVGGLKSFFFSGEGLVCQFSGKGKLYLQTHSARSFSEWIHPFRRVESKKNN